MLPLQMNFITRVGHYSPEIFEKIGILNETYRIENPNANVTDENYIGIFFFKTISNVEKFIFFVVYRIQQKIISSTYGIRHGKI